MRAYVFRRLLTFIPSLIAVALIMFFFVHLVPGDPTSAILGPDATPADRERVREDLGLNRPILVQMGSWFGDVLRGDLGHSYFLQDDVTNIIIRRIPITASLAMMGLIWSVVVGIPLGVAAAIRRDSWLDSMAMSGSVLGLSIPNFWLGLNLIFLFSVILGWLPSGGYVPWSEDPMEAFKRMILPSIGVGLNGAAIVARMTRSSMLEVLRSDFINTARAKGLSSFAVNVGHALRNAMIPVITVIGIVVGTLLNGSVVTETVFNLRGVGTLIVDAIGRRDYPVLQGGILFVTVIYLTVNLIVDLLYAWLDPRIQYTR